MALAHAVVSSLTHGDKSVSNKRDCNRASCLSGAVCLANNVLTYLSLLIASVHFASLGPCSMSLTVTLRLDNFGATRVPTETAFFGEIAAFAVVVGQSDQLFYDIIHSFVNFFVFLVVVRSCHFGIEFK
jgi:hypothetical protein